RLTNSGEKRAPWRPLPPNIGLGTGPTARSHNIDVLRADPECPASHRGVAQAFVHGTPAVAGDQDGGQRRIRGGGRPRDGGAVSPTPPSVERRDHLDVVHAGSHVSGGRRDRASVDEADPEPAPSSEDPLVVEPTPPVGLEVTHRVAV